MKKEWLVKTLALSTIVLLHGTIIASSFNTNSTDNPQPINRGWRYVGGSGPGNYSTIQDAIDFSNPGDNIFVFNGTYYECVNIDKDIYLWGEDKNITIIDGYNYDGCVISIDSNGVNIKGFTIQNCGTSGVGSAGVWVFWSLYSTISGNIITNNNGCGIILDGGGYNNIADNIIKNNDREAIMVWCDGNTITGNTISKNYFGISTEQGNNNFIYHNNFINDDGNAYNSGSNVWNDSYPSGGNYWNDYSGTDNYMGPNQDIPGSDGIGDTPHYIYDDSYDFYPLMNPWGKDLPVANFTYLVEEGRYVDFNASSSYDPDGTIVRYDWDFGDGSFNFDTFYLMSHKYCDNGIYNVTLTVTDNDGFRGSSTQPVEINENIPPPCPPSIDGPKSGKPKVDYNYTFVSVNPDAEDIFLWIDWGDGTNSSWIGPFYAGEQVTQSHKWTEKGVYIIKAKNKDIHCGHESYWAEFEVTMPRNREIYLSLFFRFLEQLPILKYFVIRG